MLRPPLYVAIGYSDLNEQHLLSAITAPGTGALRQLHIEGERENGGLLLWQQGVQSVFEESLGRVLRVLVLVLVLGLFQ